MARESQKRRDRLTTDSISTLQLTAGAARVALLPALGGSIGGFVLGDRPILRETPDEAVADSNVRLSSCYPLVPYSNRIREARLTFGQRTFALIRNFGDSPHAIHGVGWQRHWQVETATPTRATLSLHHDARGDEAASWPWPFRATQTFDLACANESFASLTVTLTIRNTGDSAFPFGLGWHPFFPRDPSTTLQFAATDVWINDETALPIERVAAQGRWAFHETRPVGDATIDNVFVGWNGRTILQSVQRGVRATIEADSSCNCFVVYAPAGRDFVALEPVSHETDAFNRAEMGAIRTGMRLLGSRTASIVASP